MATPRRDETGSDQELLFGVLAVQLGFATPQQVIAAAAAWAVDRSQPLAAHLERAGALDASRRAMVAEVVSAAVRAHGGDPKVTLASVGGDVSILQSLGASLDAGPEAEAGILADVAEAGEDVVQVTPEASGRYSLREPTTSAPTTSKDSAELGRGGIGRVLVAFDEHLGRDVALKELLPGRPGTLGGTPGHRLSAGLARFLREARVTGQLEHPNIVPVYELGRRADGTVYYTMKIVRGRTLADALAGAKGLRARLELLGHFIDVCQAVAYAHSRGVIHRDIKPENVMLGEFGETVLLDWGLAKVRGKGDIRRAEIEREIELFRDHDPGKTVDGHAIGTPAYMSPEQAHGEVEAIDERSDVWSLGAMLYEILTGRPPFSGLTPIDLIARVANASVVPVREVEADVSVELAAVCDKALQRQPEDRYATAGALAADVHAYLVGGRVRSYSYSAWELLARFVRQNRVAAAAAATVIGVVIAAFVLIALAWDAEHRERLDAAHNLARAHVEKAEQLFEGGRLLEARIHAAAALQNDPGYPGSRLYDPTDGHTAAHLSSALAVSKLYLVDLEPRLTLRQRLPLGLEADVLALSPDGQTLAVGHLNGEVRLFAVANGGPLTTLTTHYEQLTDLAFSADGEWLATAGRGVEPQLWNVAAMAEPIPLQGGSPMTTAIAFHPSGTPLIAVDGSGGVHAWAVPSGERLWSLADAQEAFRAVDFLPGGAQVALSGRLIQLRAPADGELLDSFGQIGGGIRGGLGFAASADLFAKGVGANRIGLWSAADHSYLLGLTAHGDSINRLHFAEQGRTLVSTDVGGMLCVWHARERALEQCLNAQNGVASHVGTADGRLIITGSYGRDKSIRIWERSPPARELTRLEGHRGMVITVAYDPTGHELITSAGDGELGFWSLEPSADPRGTTRLSEHGTILSLSVSPDSTRVAVATGRGVAAIWDRASRELLRVLEHDQAVHEIRFSPDGSLVATAARDGAYLWDPYSGSKQAVFPGGHTLLPSVAFSADGRLLAVSGPGGVVVLWDLATRSMRGEARGHVDAVTGLSFSRDGRWLATAGKDGRVGIWDAADARPVAMLTAHRQWVNEVTFSPNGRYLASASDDRTVILWTVEDWTPRLVLPTDSQATGIAFAPSGSHLALGNGKRVEIYPLDDLDLEPDPNPLLGQALQALGASLEGFTIELGQ